MKYLKVFSKRVYGEWNDYTGKAYRVFSSLKDAAENQEQSEVIYRISPLNQSEAISVQQMRDEANKAQKLAKIRELEKEIERIRESL